MSYTLVIVESPAKCNKIESYLGEGYKCAASFGHIRELADGLKSIDVANNFNPTFKECEDKKPQIAKLRKLIESAKEVLLASDDDREGEAIAWHLCQVFGLPVKTTKRIVFHEITETALKRAVAEATTLNMNVVNAQLSRQVLDVLVGYKLSPVLWKYITKCKKTGLSAGRCQTPALRLVYENQKEIEASPGKKVYTTTGYFTAHNLPFVLNYNHEDDVDGDGKDESEISTFLEKSVHFNHIYSCSPIRTTIKQPPTPFTTSTLQQTANNELRISPKETMKICQTLYEGGYITYMRTDSTTYSKEFIEKTILYIDKTYGKEYINKRLTASDDEKEKEKEKEIKKKEKKNKKVEKEVKPHEAIRPTDIQLVDLKDEKMTAKEIKMYALIRRNTLESCMSPATYNGFTAVVTAPAIALAVAGKGQQMASPPAISYTIAPGGEGAAPPQYRYAVEQPVFKGWKIVEGVEDNKEFNYLQALANKNTTKEKEKECILKYKKITAKVTMKDLKSHLSESKLVQLLEQNGIGRPSTFSSLIDKIQERGYVKLDNVKGVALKCSDYELEGDELSEIEVEREFGNEKNKLVIQPTGIIVLEFLLQHFDSLFQYDYTKHMEDSLDRIANGTKLWYELCRECLEQITTLTNDLTVDKTSPTQQNGVPVDNHHVYMIGKYGPVLKCTIGDKVSFKPVIETVNLDKLKRGEYTLEELVVENKLTGHFLGMYDNKEVHLKNGKFGYYVEYGDMKKSVRIGLKKPTEVTLDDIADVLFDSTSEEAFSRIITTDLSIKNGKFGDYIFYKTKTMKKPQFLKLKGFKEDYKTCELSILIKWINETYKI